MLLTSNVQTGRRQELKQWAHLHGGSLTSVFLWCYRWNTYNRWYNWQLSYGHPKTAGTVTPPFSDGWLHQPTDTFVLSSERKQERSTYLAKMSYNEDFQYWSYFSPYLFPFLNQYFLHSSTSGKCDEFHVCTLTASIGLRAGIMKEPSAAAVASFKLLSW